MSQTEMLNSSPLDAARAARFAGRLVDILNDGALALMTSIGHRTGLFDQMAELPPSTSEQIAAAAGLHERYVREWLGAMVTGGFVTYEPAQRLYALPAEHAAALTRAATPNNLAAFAQYIPLLGAVEEGILRCFQRGGGLPYSAFERFHEVMAEDSGQTVLGALFDHILPLVPGLETRLREGIDVLDLGCGRGRALLALAKAFPRSRFLGIDLSVEATTHAQNEAHRQELMNVTFSARDAATFDAAARFDFITTFDAIHDQAHPARVLHNIRRALRPGGVYLMQDIASTSHLERDHEQPLAPLLYTVSCLHCMTVSLAAGGEGLGTMWGRDRALKMLRDAGFDQVDVHRLSHDVQNEYFVARGS